MIEEGRINNLFEEGFPQFWFYGLSHIATHLISYYGGVQMKASEYDHKGHESSYVSSLQVVYEVLKTKPSTLNWTWKQIRSQ